MAVAVHIDAKLHGKKLMEEEGLSQDEITDRLAYNEHIRWMAFMRSEGYCTTDSESMKIYAPMVEKNRDDLSKLHPCITDWDKLDSLSAEYNKLGISEKQEDFKKSDYDIVKNMPEILRVSEKL